MIDNWWQTELGGPALGTSPTYAMRPGKCGVSVPGSEADVVDEARKVLERDGTFKQRVALENEKPVTVRGSWQFDPRSERTRLDLYGSLVVDNGFGKLRTDWRKVEPGLVSLPVEMLWFKITIGSGGEFPYLKQ